MSSLTIEHYGLIGLLVLLHGLYKSFKLCRDECFGKVVIYIDNKKAVVIRGAKEHELINISNYAVPEQDLWMLTMELINTLPIDIELRWIKAHQDTNKYGRTINGPFNKEVSLNILADKLVDKG